MISHYKYCGWIKDANNKTKIWGIVVWVTDGWTSDYLFWGNPDQLKIKKPQVYDREKQSWISERIKKKMKQGYIKLQDKDIEEKLPQLDSEISMFMMLKKLKNA